MNLIVKNLLVTLLLPKITVATQTTQTTTIITRKLAHTTTATPKATIKCLRECCTMAEATPTAATPRLLTVQNNVRENILNNVTTTTTATTTIDTKNVQLHATKENMRQQHQHQHQHQYQLKYLNALGKCVKITTKQEQQQQQQEHVNKTSSSSSNGCLTKQPNTLPLYQQQQQQTTAKIQTSFPTFTKNETKISTPSSSLLSSSPAAAALLPSSSFSSSSSSSCTWYRHSSNSNSNSSSRSTSTSTSSRLARLIAPTRLLNELYSIIFMTLLVLSICHNNVLETSAASVKISRREILAAPSSVSALASVSVSASTPRVVKQAIMPSGEAESPFNQRQHSPEQIISPAKAQSYFSQDEQPHQPLERDKRRESVDEGAEEAEIEMETDNSNNIFQPQIQPQYLPTYQQHYQQHHYQEEQMQQQQQQQQQHHLTTPTTTKTTTTTSFSHGMALETTYNHTFQSLSIIDGDLAVSVVDTSHQNLMTVEEELLMAAAGGAPGVGSSSLSLDDFHLHDNILSSYDATSTGLDGAAGIEFTHHHAVANSMPIFDFGMPRNITARTGHTEAVIKCRVDRLDDKSVSWIRKRDLHILTVGTATYTSDKRFQVTESKDSREWTLHVKSPQARDSGIYECQVNTEPKMSMAFQLNVIEISPDAKAVITGPADLHFKVGSAIILTCIVHQPSVKDIGPIYWYRGEYMITPFDINDNNHDESIGAGIDDTVTQNKVNVLEQNQHATHTHTHHQHNAGIYGAGTGANVGGGGRGSGSSSSSSTTATDAEQQPQILTNEITQDFAQRIAMESQLGDTMKSRLRISNAQTSDTGNYTCQPTTASSASVMVHVINDENPAAMQKSGASSNNNKRQENMMPLLSATLLLTIASAMASLLNMAAAPATARVRAPAIRNGNEWWLSTAITTALLAKTISTMRFTIEIIKSYITAMLSYHLHCDVISMLQGIDLIQQQLQQQAQLIIVLLVQPRQHELCWNYYSKRPCYRIHNNILRNSYANNNNNNGKYFMQNGRCLCIIVVTRGYFVSHPAYDIISYNAITVTVTDTVTDIDSDNDNDTATDTTLTALCCVAEIVCRISVEPAFERLRGLQYASIQH